MPPDSLAAPLWTYKTEALPRLGVQAHTLAFAIVGGCIFFNAALAIVNAQVTGLGKLHVIAVEVLFVGAALGVGVMFWQRAMRAWIWLLWALCVAGVVLAFFRQSFDPKLLRDVVLIPTFVILGIAAASSLRNFRPLILFVVALQAAVVAAMAFEALTPQAFSDLFGVQSYYINTRDFAGDSFWNENSDLFVSATRPGARFWFDGIPIHRLSSVFLEPVSLGNWAILMTIFAVAFWPHMGWAARLFFAGTILATLVGSDGRLATVTCAIVVAGAWFFPRLPRYSHMAYLPAALGAAVALVGLLGLEPVGDNFTGRLAHTVYLLQDFSAGAWFGIDHSLRGPAADSGIGYLILTQSVIGTLALWCWIAFNAPTRTLRARTFVHGLLLYLALTMMVSYSLFSIKTAALSWFLLGALCAMEGRDGLFEKRRHRDCFP